MICSLIYKKTKALEYNVPHGKKTRGLTAVLVYKDLIGKERHTAENLRQGHILGWSIEFVSRNHLNFSHLLNLYNCLTDKV